MTKEQQPQNYTPEKLNELLQKNIIAGNLEEIKRLVEIEGADVNGSHPYEAGANAIYEPHTLMVFMAPEKHSRGLSNRPPYGIREISSGIEIANYLVEKGAVIQKPHFDHNSNATHHVQRFYMKFWLQSSPLLFAIVNDDVNEVKNLLNTNGNINEVDSYGNTALHVAAAEGNLEIVKIILEAGVNIDKPNNKGQTAIIFAANYNYPLPFNGGRENSHGEDDKKINKAIIIGTIIEHGASKDGIEQCKLFSTDLFANIVKYGNEKGVRALMRMGMDINTKLNPYKKDVTKGTPEYEYLRKYEYSPRTYLSDALRAGLDIEFIKVLLEYGADFKEVEIPKDHPNKKEIEKLFKEYPKRLEIMKEMLGDIVDKEGQVISRPGELEKWKNTIKDKFPKIKIPTIEKIHLAKGLGEILNGIFGVNLPNIVLAFLGKNFDPSKTISESLREIKKDVLWTLDPNRGLLKKKQTLEEVLKKMEENPFGKGLRIVDDSDEEDKKYPSPKPVVIHTYQSSDSDLNKALNQSAEEYDKSIVKKVTKESEESEQKRRENVESQLSSAVVPESPSKASAKSLAPTTQKKSK